MNTIISVLLSLQLNNRQADATTSRMQQLNSAHDANFYRLFRSVSGILIS